MSDAGAWIFVRETLLLLKERGVINDEFILEILARAETVAAHETTTPHSAESIRLSIEEMRDIISAP